MTTVSSVAEFVQQITELDNSLIRDGGPNNETLLFRGQSNKAFDLLPSIARGRKFACDISIFSEERNMIEEAKYKLPNVFNDSLAAPRNPNPPFGHYGKCFGRFVFCLRRKCRSGWRSYCI